MDCACWWKSDRARTPTERWQPYASSVLTACAPSAAAGSATSTCSCEAVERRRRIMAEGGAAMSDVLPTAVIADEYCRYIDHLAGRVERAVRSVPTDKVYVKPF